MHGFIECLICEKIGERHETEKKKTRKKKEERKNGKVREKPIIDPPQTERSQWSIRVRDRYGDAGDNAFANTNGHGVPIRINCFSS